MIMTELQSPICHTSVTCQTDIHRARKAAFRHDRIQSCEARLVQLKGSGSAIVVGASCQVCGILPSCVVGASKYEVKYAAIDYGSTVLCADLHVPIAGTACTEERLNLRGSEHAYLDRGGSTVRVVELPSRLPQSSLILFRFSHFEMHVQDLLRKASPLFDGVKVPPEWVVLTYRSKARSRAPLESYFPMPQLTSSQAKGMCIREQFVESGHFKGHPVVLPF